MTAECSSRPLATLPRPRGGSEFVRPIIGLLAGEDFLGDKYFYLFLTVQDWGGENTSPSLPSPLGGKLGRATISSPAGKEEQPTEQICGDCGREELTGDGRTQEVASSSTLVPGRTYVVARLLGKRSLQVSRCDYDKWSAGRKRWTGGRASQRGEPPRAPVG